MKIVEEKLIRTFIKSKRIQLTAKQKNLSQQDLVLVALVVALAVLVAAVVVAVVLVVAVALTVVAVAKRAEHLHSAL